MADVDVEEEPLDFFSQALPLPYRLAVLTVLGVWLWGVNLHVLRLLKIVRLSEVKIAITNKARGLISNFGNV